jgi:hypothetical protein
LSKRQGIKSGIEVEKLKRRNGRRREIWSREEEDSALTGGSHLSARGSEKGWVTVRDRKDGPQAPLTSGPKGFPRGPSLFFVLFFSFSEILFPLEILHNETKQGQTKF